MYEQAKLQHTAAAAFASENPANKQQQCCWNREEQWRRQRAARQPAELELAEVIGVLGIVIRRFKSTGRADAAVVETEDVTAGVEALQGMKILLQTDLLLRKVSNQRSTPRGPSVDS